MEYLIIGLLITAILYVLGNHIKKQNTKHSLKINEQNNKMQEYEFILDSRKKEQKRDLQVIANLGGVIDSQETEIEVLKRAKKYAQKKVTEHEITISELTGDKQILKGRKFKD